MSIVSRFFGKKEACSENGLVANEDVITPLSLQVLFSKSFKINSALFEKKLRKHHPKLAMAEVELIEDLVEQSKTKSVTGMIGWDNHIIQLIGFDCPMQDESVENCIRPSHYGSDLKKKAREHKSHLILYYRGYEKNLIKQYSALALISGFLTDFDAIVVINESAKTSFPTEALRGKDVEGDIFELLETLPLTALYCGFVKYEVEDVDGVWLRTYGAHMLNLPDMASLVEDHSFSESVFDIFNNSLLYLINSGAKLKNGDTMQVGKDLFMKLRVSQEKEYFLASKGDLFVAEFIQESEINQP